MKSRNGFVSNSSSTSFVIYNNTKEVKTLVDFVKENPQIVDEYNDEYTWDYNDKNRKLTFEELLKSAEENNFNLEVGSNSVTFGDEDGTVIGRVFDYMLREGGSSTSFSWDFVELNR